MRCEVCGEVPQTPQLNSAFILRNGYTRIDSTTRAPIQLQSSKRDSTWFITEINWWSEEQQQLSAAIMLMCSSFGD